MKNVTMAVPSFSKFSPSIIIERLFEAPTDFIKVNTATVSVAEIIAPKRLH
jgi:hypothetical protein